MNAAIEIICDDEGVNEMPKSWSRGEIEFLQENWGKFTVAYLAKQLDRSVHGVILKAKRMALGPSKENQGLLTANQLSVALGIDRHTVVDFWIERCNLRAIRKATRNVFRFYLVDANDFWKWAEENQEKFDSRRIEPLILGPEPPWMKQKRRADLSLPTRRLQKWTTQEDKRLRELYKANIYTYAEIGRVLGRSRESVERRLSRIDIWTSSGNSDAKGAQTILQL